MINFGKKKPDIKQYAIIAIVLSTIITSISQCTKISENNLWDLLDEIQRKYFPQTILNDFIIKDDKKLERRIKRDVDRAIAEYERLTGNDGTVKLLSPRRSEKAIDASVCYTFECQALGGEIRICAPWVDNCPSDVVK